MCRCACLLVLALLWPFGLAAQEAAVTLDQARQIARQALVQQEPAIALEIGRGLLEADPRDADALLIVAAAQAQLGNPVNGRRAAARAYRNSARGAVRLDAATIAAGLSLRAGRPTLTQIWLRRASLHTDDPEAQARIMADYRRVRAQNPWRFTLTTSLRPSSNVNNGAEQADQIVDGIDVSALGTLSASALALPGVIATGQLELGYRLRGTARSRTEVIGRLRVRRVDLSQEARAKADQARRDALAAGVPEFLIPPDPQNRDFGSTYADVTLRHQVRVGETAGNTAMLALGFGGFWYGTRHDARLARLDARRTWAIGEAAQITLHGSVALRDEIGSARGDSTTYAVLGGYARRMADGARLSLGLSLADTRSDQRNNAHTAWSLRAQYGFARNWGPAEVTAGMALSHADYPVYALTNTLLVPGGRQDRGAFADLTLFFEEYDYLGFAPEVTLRAGQRSSNVSRFETRELSVSLGVQSKF